MLKNCAIGKMRKLVVHTFVSMFMTTNSKKCFKNDVLVFEASKEIIMFLKGF